MIGWRGLGSNGDTEIMEIDGTFPGAGPSTVFNLPVYTPSTPIPAPPPAPVIDNTSPPASSSGVSTTTLLLLAGGSLFALVLVGSLAGGRRR